MASMVESGFDTDTGMPRGSCVNFEIEAQSTDSLRDLVATIVETNLSVRDYRQNQVMKKVTSWAAIIAVPTLVTGFYGMNVRFAGLGTTWAAWLAVALIVVTSVTLYVMFRRRDWL